MKTYVITLSKRFPAGHCRANNTHIVVTDYGRELTDKEVRAYARWGLLHGYKLLSELPEFETIKELNHDETAIH